MRKYKQIQKEKIFSFFILFQKNYEKLPIKKRHLMEETERTPNQNPPLQNKIVQSISTDNTEDPLPQTKLFTADKPKVRIKNTYEHIIFNNKKQIKEIDETDTQTQKSPENINLEVLKKNKIEFSVEKIKKKEKLTIYNDYKLELLQNKYKEFIRSSREKHQSDYMNLLERSNGYIALKKCLNEANNQLNHTRKSAAKRKTESSRTRKGTKTPAKLIHNGNSSNVN